MKKTGLLFVVSGPSGSGKTTLIKGLIKDRQLKNILVKSISFTTRTKRIIEKEGRDYFFVSREEFRRLLKRKKIIEWTNYLSYDYGTPRDYLDAQLKDGKSVVLCLDTRGAACIKRIYPEKTIRIFILPPKIEILRERICARAKGRQEKDLRERLGRAKKEISAARNYDYQIVNDDLKSALRELRKIILKEICI